MAEAWLQPAWADYSGVSRSLTVLTQAEAEQIRDVLDKISQPFIDREAMLSIASPGYLVLDGDLTPHPVSDTSTSYSGAAYGHMDEKQLGQGYQAAKVSSHAPTYGRLLLSSALHPGNVVSCTQAKALVEQAEERTRMRPLRRTDLLAQRLEIQVQDREERDRRYQETRQMLEKTKAQIPETWRQIQDRQSQLEAAEREYQEQGRVVRPFSKPGKLRQQLEVLQRRRVRLEEKLPGLEEQLVFRRQRLRESMQAESELRQRLQQYEQENTANSFPIRAVFRLDAGFGTAETSPG